MKNPIRWAIAAVVIAFAVTIIAGAFRPRNPIVINMPADAKPLAELEKHPTFTNSISGEKAILWWTVYKASLDHGSGSQYSIEAANAAIHGVYGK